MIDKRERRGSKRWIASRVKDKRREDIDREKLDRLEQQGKRSSIS